MVALTLSIPISPLATRMRDRLGGSAARGPTIVWQQPGGQRLLVYINSLEARPVDGWLLCNLDAATDQTKRQRLQFVYFLGRRGEGDRQQAAATINAPTVQAAQLAATWGSELQRVLWDAVLDAVEACVHRASVQHDGKPITLQGDGLAVVLNRAIRLAMKKEAPQSFCQKFIS